MAGLAGADAEVSLAHPLLPTLPPYPQKQRDGHYGPLLLTEGFRRPREASSFLKRSSTEGCQGPKAHPFASCQ